MRYSLRTKLSASYIVVALVSILLLSLLSNVFLERFFGEYVKRNQERKNHEIVNLIAQQYKEGGRWESAVIEDIGINALEQGMILKVKTVSGENIWDATVHNSGMCQEMINHMAKNMQSRYPSWEGSYVENKYPVVHQLKEVGSVEVGYYGPFFFTDSDLAFLNTLNQLIVGVGIVSLLFALLLGAFMAKRLSNPISRVIQTAQMISKGYFGDRITEKSSTREIGQLTETINHLAETLEKQEVLRKRLTADVAHELRTPLATLQSHLEAMIDGIWKPDAQRLQSCHDEIVRIGRMVGGLEKLARYESENVVLNRTEFDISGLIRSIIHNFEGEFVNKDLKLEFQGEEETVFADKDKISQILVNLLSNALKYTPEGGLVKVGVKSSPDWMEISVKDTGTGIPEEDLPYIFERFYRADRSRNRLTGGSGIGLTITKAMVEAHDGKITVQSRPGEGTEFIVSIPRRHG